MEDFQLRKKELEKGKPMTAASFVNEARQLAGRMVEREMRGPGDLDNAMRRIEQRYGVPYQALWNLRYRTPKEIAAHVYAGIVAAYSDQCDRQARLLKHERTITEAKGLLGKALVRAADALACEKD